MSALLIFVGLGLLAYGGYSALVLPTKPLARGESRRATQLWATGVLVALAGVLALVIGVSDSLVGGIVGSVVLGGVVVGGGAYQWKRMLTKVEGR
ncbi:MAG: hypothetical protein H0T66_02225 [Geodermatophilaceae bacterium]|nr:hypothetical protein [Geodermatophilaceae bacterium]MDQ3454560.1 hypothetical protein [Actinomycetota bacterium]